MCQVNNVYSFAEVFRYRTVDLCMVEGTLVKGGFTAKPDTCDHRTYTKMYDHRITR